jgi:predicted Zn-ribbon and HTH transcriptional regulator
MYTRKKIALMIEHKLGYTNGWRVDDETYENECLMAADELIKLFDLPNVVGSSCPECGSANTQQKTKSNDECKDCKSEWAI